MMSENFCKLFIRRLRDFSGRTAIPVHHPSFSGGGDKGR